MMKAVVALAIFALIAVASAGNDPPDHTECDITWEKVGCFKDKKDRALPELLLNDRSTIDWNEWEESTHSLACRCAQKAYDKDYTVFGLQFYGECWSGPDGESDYMKYGETRNCIMDLGKLGCDKEAAQVCVGKHWANYVYRVTGPKPCEEAIDLAVILDTSRSIPKRELPVAKGFVLNITRVSQVKPDATHIGLIVFNRNAETLITFNDTDKQSPQAVEEALQPVKRDQGTHTDEALTAAEKVFTQDKGDRADKPNVLIVITDGRNRGGSLDGPLDDLKKKEVEIIAVGVGTQNHDELLQIALGKEDHVFELDDFDELNDLLQSILDSSCPSASA